MKCPRCSANYGNKFTACPNCLLLNREYLTFVPESITSRYFSGFTGQKYSHSIEEIETQFRSILNRAGVVSKGLTVKASGAVEGIFDISITRSGDVSLTLNEKLVDYIAPTDLTEYLKHEACYLFTLDSTEMTVAETQQEMMDYLIQHTKSYDEFLAHREFAKRWPNDSAFLGLKTRELDNYAIILCSLRKSVQERRFPNLQYIFQTLSEVYQDAVYFRLIDPRKMMDCCRECDATAVYEFFEFWFEDCQYIAGGSFDRETTMVLAQLSAVLSMSVDVDSLLNRNLVLFKVDLGARYKPFLNEMKPHERTLIQKWIDRSR